MKDEYMTLAAALATGLPFKHIDWPEYLNPTADVKLWVLLPSFYEPVWQVQRPKEKMRIWKSQSGAIWIGSEPPATWPVVYDATDQLKEILKDSDNG